MADQRDETSLDSLIERTRKAPDVRARLLADPEETLAELGIALPNGLASWRAWKMAHYCGCNELFVRNAPAAPRAFSDQIEPF